MKTQAVAYQVAEGIHINRCKETFGRKLLFSDSDELFFELSTHKYLYIFRYGIVCTYNVSDEELSLIFEKISETAINSILTDEMLSETLDISTEMPKLSIDFNEVSITDNDSEKIRLLMLNLSQSVALDHYAGITENLLIETQKHTSQLEIAGKLDIGGKTLKRFIGKVLNIKNKISEKLYIFDSPDVAWDSESLNQLNRALKRKFDLKDRYQVISQQLNIVKENLDLFKDIMDHRESSRLEWIIIILIVIEVIDMLILKIS